MNVHCGHPKECGCVPELVSKLGPNYTNMSTTKLAAAVATIAVAIAAVGRSTSAEDTPPSKSRIFVVGFI